MSVNSHLLTEVNASKRLVQRLPHQASVDSWVAQAKKLARAIHYQEVLAGVAYFYSGGNPREAKTSKVVTGVVR